MCCFILLLGFFGPRVTLVYLWLTGYLNGAFRTVLWPLLGFFFAPFTTLIYAIAMHNGGLTLFWMIMIGIGLFFDLGVYGGSERHRRGRASA